MTNGPRVIKSTNPRAWLIAFQRGFRSSSSFLEPPSDDLLGLLQMADLRAAGEGLVITEQATSDARVVEPALKSGKRPASGEES
jgi:hypothetical protein